MIRKLLYLTNIRPNLCFFVNLLIQFMQFLTNYHCRALQHIRRYIKFSPLKGLFFIANSHIQIKTFNDLDWTTCPNTRRSITSFCTFLGLSLISWKSKKQSIVPRSFTEVEHRVLIVIVWDKMVSLSPSRSSHPDNYYRYSFFFVKISLWSI